MARAAAVAALSLALAGAAAPWAPAARAAPWSAPSRLAGPSSIDVLPAAIAFSPQGDAAVTFGFRNFEHLQTSSAYVGILPATGPRSAPRRVPRALEILDQGFRGATLDLLTATSPSGDGCCHTIDVATVSPGGRFGRPHAVLDGSSGPAIGNVLEVGAGREVVAVASTSGVFTAASGPRGRFGRTLRLTPRGVQPGSLAAAALPGGRSVLAWTESDAGRILVATATRGAAPRRRRLALALAPGHRVDELALAARGAVATAGWIESWVDTHGVLHSRALLADIGGSGRAGAVHAVSSPVALAVGLSLAGDDRGDALAAWKECSSVGLPCAVHTVGRNARGRLVDRQRLGRIDATETPAVALAGRGAELIGWILGGGVRVAARPAVGRRLGSAAVISRTTLAADLTFEFGPQGGALAAWTQGTRNPSVIVARYRGGR